MKTKFALFALQFALFAFLSGCATPTTGTGTGSNPEQFILDANGTISAANRDIEETRAAQAMQTVQAQQATEQARAAQTVQAQQATGTAIAVAAEATRAAVSTAESMMIQQTAVSLQMSIDEATRAAQAKGTAIAVTIAAEQAREAQRAENVAMLRAVETQRYERDLFWRNIMNGLKAGAILAFIIFLLMAGAAIISRVRSMNRNPVQQFSDGDQTYNFLIVQDGLFRTDVRQIGRSAASIPQIEPGPDEPLLALPGPVRELQPIKLGHVLIAGNSGSGKSTAVRAILRGREGETIVVDPHAAPNEWDADRVIGRGRFDEIAEFMEWMKEELQRRRLARGNGERLQFPPLTVATDELPAIVSELGSAVVTDSWKSWIHEGRKFNLWAIVSSQSTRVKALGIAGEGDVREHFSAVISLGSEAVRRYPDLARGMSRPAILQMGSGEPQRITVPNVPAFAASGRARTVTIEPAADEESAETQPAGIMTDRGFIPADEVQEIIRWGKELQSLRAVSNQVYQSTGGIGFYKTREVLNRFNIQPG